MAHLESNLHSAMPSTEESLEPKVEAPQERDPYEAPVSELELEAEEVSKTDELKAFVGKNTDYYLNQWSDRSYNFNWAAFFLSGFWLAYRKMYWQVLVLLGATVVLSLVLQALGITQAWIPSLVIGLVCGTYGDRWYHNHALRVVRKFRLKEPRTDERIMLLAKRGGVSQILVIAVIVIAVIVITSQLYPLVMS